MDKFLNFGNNQTHAQIKFCHFCIDENIFAKVADDKILAWIFQATCYSAIFNM